MSDLNPEVKKIKLGDTEYDASFPINAIDNIQQEYPTLQDAINELYIFRTKEQTKEMENMSADQLKAFEREGQDKAIKALVCFIKTMINEEISYYNEDCEKGKEKKELTDKKVKHYITMNNFTSMREQVTAILLDYLPKNDKKDNTPTE